jgi:hypothetical protein
MKTASQFISEFFSPLLVPLLTFMLLISRYGDVLAPPQKILIFTVAAIFSSAGIYLYVYYLKHKRIIESTELLVREQRVSPLTFAVLSYSLGYFFLNAVRAPALICGFMFCYAVNTFFLLLITRSWKISMHTSCIAAAVVSLHYAYGPIALPAYGLIPLVGVARLIMQRQSLLQVAAGGLLGLSMTLLLMRGFAPTDSPLLPLLFP